MKRFSRRIALVTGAASGIGRACAARLAAEGAVVFAADIRAEDGPEASEGPVQACRLDVTDPQGWRALAAQIAATHGHLDILLNCAGIVTADHAHQSAEAVLPHMRAVQAVNFEGVWLGIETCAPLLARKGGAIVNVASRAAEIGVPAAPDYAASKAALVSLTRSLALRFAAEGAGIRCNAVLPGSIDTPLWRPLGAGAQVDRDEAVRRAFSQIPMRRLGTADEVAAAILFLASDDASYITGATLNVDGGQIAT